MVSDNSVSSRTRKPSNFSTAVLKVETSSADCYCATAAAVA